MHFQDKASLVDRRDLCDSIIVSSGEQNFNEIFLGQNQWGPIKVSENRLSQIKYLFLYQRKPVSCVTHYAKVKSIIPDEIEKGKFRVLFEGEPVALDKEITLGQNPSKAPQNPRYIKYEIAMEAKNTDELFDY
jgi:hypothetical protein